MSKTRGRRIEGVESALAELREEGQRTRESLGQVLTDVKQLQSDMAETRTDVRRIDGRLDRGFGTNYEAKVAQNVRSILGQQARVRNSRGLNGPSLRTDPDFTGPTRTSTDRWRARRPAGQSPRMRAMSFSCWT